MNKFSSFLSREFINKPLNMNPTDDIRQFLQSTDAQKKDFDMIIHFRGKCNELIKLQKTLNNKIKQLIDSVSAKRLELVNMSMDLTTQEISFEDMKRDAIKIHKAIINAQKNLDHITEELYTDINNCAKHVEDWVSKVSITEDGEVNVVENKKRSHTELQAELYVMNEINEHHNEFIKNTKSYLNLVMKNL